MNAITRYLPAIAALAAAALLAACGDDGASSAPADDATPDTTADTNVPDDASDATPPDAGPDTDPGTPAFDPVAAVDPFVGTSALGFNFGALFPGPKRPFGMVALSPDTEGTAAATWGTIHAGGYYYLDTDVMGFSHIHLAGTGVADYGNLLVVPAVGDPTALLADGDPPNLALDHEREEAAPGYYRLDTDAVTSELTATDRAGAHRYTFAPTADALIAVDVTHALGLGTASESAVTVDAATGEITGSVHIVGDFTSRFGGFDLFFVVRPNRIPTAVGTWDPDGYVAGRTATGGTSSGVGLAFDATTDPVVELRVGISFVDEAGALANLEAEAAGRDFDGLVDEAQDVWRDALGVVEVEGGTETRRRLLYTALYHAQLMPTLFTDVDGRYRGLDTEVHTADDFTYYTDFSMWDTYRTFHPLASMIFPDRQRDFLRSLGRMAVEGGTMPAWPLATGYTGSMIGTGADVVFGDAVLKGFAPPDLASSFQKMKELATGPAPNGRPGRDDFDVWTAHKYLPADMAGGSVSKALEYAIDDFCLGVVAQELGLPDDVTFFGERATWWTNHWDAEKEFLAPRNSDGTFPEYKTTAVIDPYVEGTAWHYLFMVPHDVPGLVTLLGGEAGFLAKLSTFLEKGRDSFSMTLPNAHYYHGNEPDILAPWLFGWGGRPDLTRAWTEWVADTWYQLAPDGLAGNDDGGTLSSWYVFAAMGLYPNLCQGSYITGTPLFDRVTVHLEAGDLVVTRGDDVDGPTRLDGVVLDGWTLSHDAIASGAALELPPAPALPE